MGARNLEDRIQGGDCLEGVVKYSPLKSLWWSGMVLTWAIGGTIWFSWGAVGIFFITSAIVLCGGHSIGMHRKLIHNSFDCPQWLEYIGVYLGTLTGLGGPYTMMFTHDMRDYAQHQSECHDFLRHGRSLWRDAYWQLHCKLYLRAEPYFEYPNTLTRHKLYKFLQATSMAQQIPIAVLLFALGGWGFVFWGVCGRVSISIFGHWLIGYFAHNHGQRDWHVKGAAVQGHNVRFCGLITFGEAWHNNHHAFPESARIGLRDDQADPGWWTLKTLEKIGLVSNLVLPKNLEARAELTPTKILTLEPDKQT